MFARLFALGTRAALRALGARTTSHSIEGWRLRVHRMGRPGGEPWLLLHGLGATSATFLPLARTLRDDAELWLPELSALGGTRGPRAALCVGDAVRVLAALIERELAGRPVTLCGISLGGWIAIRLAAEHPQNVARVLAVVPGGYRDQDWRRIERTVRVSTFADTRAMWNALFVRPSWWLRLARWGFFLAYSSTAVAAVLDSVRESEAFGDEDLARIRVPVGLLWGESDSLFRIEVGRRMVAALPRGRLWAVAQAAHGVQWERPREFVAAVEEFRATFPLPSAGGGAQDGREPRGGGRWPSPTI